MHGLSNIDYITTLIGKIGPQVTKNTRQKYYKNHIEIPIEIPIEILIEILHIL